VTARELIFSGVLIGGMMIFNSAWSSVVAQDVPTESGIETPLVEAPRVQKVDESKGKLETASENRGPEAEPEPAPPFDYATLYDEPENLKKLDRTAPIWISSDRKRVVLGGQICMRDGWLEFFACRANSKEHESIVALDIPPHLIHAALLVIGAKQGAPAKYDPEFVPPKGDPIDIEVCWRDAKSGERVKRSAQEMVSDEASGKTMDATWIFTGGLFGVDPDGKKYYLANVTGEVFGVANFPGSVLDVPFESSNDNSQLLYVANTEMIPEVNTDVLLILTRAEKDGAEKITEKPSNRQ
jgi:hypothetical protein